MDWMKYRENFAGVAEQNAYSKLLRISHVRRLFRKPTGALSHRATVESAKRGLGHHRQRHN